MLIYIAAIQGIPESLYEASRIDGAKPAQMFRYITVPLLMPTTLFLAVIGMISHLQDLSAPYLLTGGGPGRATELPATFMYSYTFTRNQMGIGAASAVIMLMTIAAIMTPYLYAELKEKK